MDEELETEQDLFKWTKNWKMNKILFELLLKCDFWFYKTSVQSTLTRSWSLVSDFYDIIDSMAYIVGNHVIELYAKSEGYVMVLDYMDVYPHKENQKEKESFATTEGTGAFVNEKIKLFVDEIAVAQHDDPMDNDQTLVVHDDDPMDVGSTEILPSFSEEFRIETLKNLCGFKKYNKIIRPTLVRSWGLVSRYFDILDSEAFILGNSVIEFYVKPEGFVLVFDYNLVNVCLTMEDAVELTKEKFERSVFEYMNDKPAKKRRRQNSTSLTKLDTEQRWKFLSNLLDLLLLEDGGIGNSA